MNNDPIQHLRELMSRLDKWDGLTMTADMASEYDAEVDEYRDAVDAHLPALLAVADAARKVSDEYDRERGKRGSECPFIGAIEVDLSDALAALEKQP